MGSESSDAEQLGEDAQPVNASIRSATLGPAVATRQAGPATRCDEPLVPRCRDEQLLGAVRFVVARWRTATTMRLSGGVALRRITLKGGSSCLVEGWVAVRHKPRSGLDGSCLGSTRRRARTNRFDDLQRPSVAAIWTQPWSYSRRMAS